MCVDVLYNTDIMLAMASHFPAPSQGHTGHLQLKLARILQLNVLLFNDFTETMTRRVVRVQDIKTRYVSFWKLVLEWAPQHLYIPPIPLGSNTNISVPMIMWPSK